MFVFREQSPVRTYNGTYANYQSYKPHLRADFNKRCGYTDCPDFWFGGKGTFHIDHFKPWKKYPAEPNLKTDYTNLVYACSYVNILKSDDEGSYIDPCNTNFNDHFERDSDGSIIPKTASTSAQYMYTRLRLYMKRYRVIWMLEKIINQLEKIKIAVDATKDADLKKELLVTAGELAIIFVEYRKYLEEEQ